MLLVSACSKPDCQVGCKGHECSCEPDTGEDCGLPMDATPTSLPWDVTLVDTK